MIIDKLLAGQEKIKKPDMAMYRKVKANWDAIAKPLDGMGRFEDITCKIGSILGDDSLDIRKRAVVVMCSDNGVVEEGISQSDQSVTSLCATSIGSGKSTVGMMIGHSGGKVIAVDVGINNPSHLPFTIDKKVAMGTRNFAKEAAMTTQQAMQAIEAGIDMVRQCREEGYRIIATGEMGIGNTTTSSALAAVLLDCPVEAVTGKGAGLSDQKLAHKKDVIRKAIIFHGYEGGAKDVKSRSGVLEALATFGGFDIAGMTGLMIGGALYGLPIVVDGVISMISALIAERLVTGVKDFLIPSHISREPAAAIIGRELGLRPVIDGEMALGEGTGAAMMLGLLDIAIDVYQKSNSFLAAGVGQYERI